MNEAQLLDTYPEERLEIPIYFYNDDDGNVVIDEESMRDEFEDHIKKLCADQYERHNI